VVALEAEHTSSLRASEEAARTAEAYAAADKERSLTEQRADLTEAAAVAAQAAVRQTATALAAAARESANTQAALRVRAEAAEERTREAKAQVRAPASPVPRGTSNPETSSKPGTRHLCPCPHCHTACGA